MNRSMQFHRCYLTKWANRVLGSKIKGVFIECGVKAGGSACCVSKILQRQSFLFDMWERYLGFTEKDGDEEMERQVSCRKYLTTEAYCRNALKENGTTDICTMIKGDVRKTLPDFLKNNPNLKCCFAHLDLDLYYPTKICLESLWPHMTGPVFHHDYGSPKWKGIKPCVDDFIKSNEVDFIDLDSINACIIKKRDCVIGCELERI